MFSYSGSVDPHFFANYWSHDLNTLYDKPFKTLIIGTPEFD